MLLMLRVTFPTALSSAPESVAVKPAMTPSSRPKFVPAVLAASPIVLTGALVPLAAGPSFSTAPAASSTA